MGTRFDFTVIPNTKTSVHNLACTLQQHLQFIKPAIDLSLIVYDFSIDKVFVDLVAFKNRAVRVEPSLPAMLTNLSLFSQAPPSFAELAVTELSKTPAVLIACIASTLFSTATCHLCSDSLCSTGFLHFIDGTIQDAIVYGEGGTDTMISIQKGDIQFSSHEVVSYEYWQPWHIGAQRYLGWTSDIESLGVELDAKSSYRLYMMEQRNLISPPRRDSI